MNQDFMFVTWVNKSFHRVAIDSAVNVEHNHLSKAFRGLFHSNGHVLFHIVLPGIHTNPVVRDKYSVHEIQTGFPSYMQWNFWKSQILPHCTTHSTPYLMSSSIFAWASKSKGSAVRSLILSCSLLARSCCCSSSTLVKRSEKTNSFNSC